MILADATYVRGISNINEDDWREYFNGIEERIDRIERILEEIRDGTSGIKNG